VVTNPESPVEYPADLFEQQVEGVVLLRLYVTASGTLVPDSTRIEESSGFPELDSAALRSADQLQFPSTSLLEDLFVGVVDSDGNSVNVSGLAAEWTVLDGGGTTCSSSKEVAEQSEIIIVMVPDTPHVEAVLFGENGVAEGLSKGQTVVDMSSISPIETKEFAKKINDLGCDYLDAPVSGGEVGAKNAALTIMVGGEQETFDAIKPL